MKYRKISILIITCIIVTFTLYRGISPVSQIRVYNRIVKGDSLYSNQYDRIRDMPEIMPLARESCYYAALLELSEEDSINLVVNLHDSLAMLSIKGVIIHEIPISTQKVSRLLRKIPNIQYEKLFGSPLSVKSEHATIVKEPVVVRNAPKDTIEAAMDAWQPDTLIQNPAFVMMNLDYGIRLVMEQDNNATMRDHWRRFWFRTGIRITEFLKDIGRFLTFRRPAYRPEIVIKLPVRELRAVFRALPDNAKVVLYYDSH